MEITEVVEPVSFFLLLCGSAFFSGSETALMSVNKIEIRHLQQEGNAKAAILEKLLSTPDRLISTILVGNNLVNIAASSIATKIAIDIFGNAGVGIATGLVTLLLLIFGEITPKSIANSKALQFSLTVARPIEICYYFFYPVVKVLNIITGLMTGGREGEQTSKPFISEDRIRRYLTVGEREGVIETDEKQMINSIFEFDDTRVKEILVPRIDMVCVEINDSLEELINTVVDRGLSRIPVYNDTIDNIVGIVYAKDLLPLLREKTELNIQKIMRPAYYVPETKKVDNLLSELKKEKIHMAIILDEYGGTAGLVTIEDLLEEIVGDIQDEYDEEEKLIKMIEEDELLVDGRVDIDEINQVLGANLPEEDYETISGFILSMLGYVPEAGEKIEFEDLTIEVEKVVQRRISQVKIKSFVTETESDTANNQEED
ncbi:hemolysin family protein [Halanaerobaculum tunisiense]